MPEIPETKCIAIVRGSNRFSVITALCDLVRHARLNFAGTPKVCDPAFADNVLVQVMNEPLNARCGAAAVVQLEDEPGRVIYMIRKIRAPAHVVIVSPSTISTAVCWRRSICCPTWISQCLIMGKRVMRMTIEITGNQGEKFNPPVHGIKFVNSAGIDVLINVNSYNPEHALRLRPDEQMMLIIPVYEYSARIDQEALARKNKEHELMMQYSPTYRAMQGNEEDNGGRG